MQTFRRDANYSPFPVMHSNFPHITPQKLTNQSISSHISPHTSPPPTLRYPVNNHYTPQIQKYPAAYHSHHNLLSHSKFNNQSMHHSPLLTTNRQEDYLLRKNYELHQRAKQIEYETLKAQKQKQKDLMQQLMIGQQ